jgi:hypothetical protein
MKYKYKILDFSPLGEIFESKRIQALFLLVKRDS